MGRSRLPCQCHLLRWSAGSYRSFEAPAIVMARRWVSVDWSHWRASQTSSTFWTMRMRHCLLMATSLRPPLHARDDRQLKALGQLRELGHLVFSRLAFTLRSV